jgi:multimeric flavodoxin WrbA
VELIDLGGLNIAGWTPTPPNDDFAPILPKLQDPAVAGLIIGSPSYFRGLSSLCKAFIERCAPLREPKMLLDGKPVGVIATGAFRNGGQELIIEQIQTAMLCFGMIPVGDAPLPSRAARCSPPRTTSAATNSAWAQRATPASAWPTLP